MFDQGRVVETAHMRSCLRVTARIRNSGAARLAVSALDDGATAEVERAAVVADDESVVSEETPEEVIGHDRNPKRRPLRER